MNTIHPPHRALIGAALLTLPASALLSCVDPGSIDDPGRTSYFNRFEVLGSGESLLTTSELEQRVIEEIDAAQVSILVAMENLRSEAVASALVRAHRRGVAVAVVGDLDNRAQLGFRLLEAQAPELPIRYGDGPLGYAPQPTVSVTRPGEMNRMTNNFMVFDELRIINLSDGFPGADEGDRLQLGFWSKSEDLGKDYKDEFDQMFAGVFATTLNSFNSELKSNTNNRAYYPTDRGVVEVYFGPQERTMKRLIDEIYTARGSVWIMAEELNNRFVLDALEYKALAGLNVRLVVADEDGDGVANTVDNCPTLPNPFQSDEDGDGVGNLCDNCLDDSNPIQLDSDLDGIGDACDGDDDNDRIPDPDDNCPAVVNLDQSDVDGDTRGDACDPDADNDGVLDDGDASGVRGSQRCRRDADRGRDQVSNCDDNCPTVANPDQLDENANGVGDACETDQDEDGVFDAFDNCPTVANPDQLNNDLDPVGDACDNCPAVANPGQFDANGNSVGDACDPDISGLTDTDADGVPDLFDNCWVSTNPDQSDMDSDGEGDACDDDLDNDLVPNDSDNCPTVANPAQLNFDADLDGDGVIDDTEGDVCDADADNDGALDDVDNCLLLANPDQADGDGDGVGDACDNCPGQPNPEQDNNDGDPQGDACDPDADDDGVPNGADNCPTVANPDQANFTGDGQGDLCAVPEVRVGGDFRATVVIIDALPSPYSRASHRTRVMIFSQSIVESIALEEINGDTVPRPADGFMDSNMWLINEFPNKENADVQRLQALFERLYEQAGRTEP